MQRLGRQAGKRSPIAVILVALGIGLAWKLPGWALPSRSVRTASPNPKIAGLPIHGQHRPGAQAAQWAKKGSDGGRTDEERLAFMDSPLGQAIGAFAKFLSDSPLNDGKIWFAKMQAGEYDRERVGAKVDAYISENPVVMFSFSK